MTSPIVVSISQAFKIPPSLAFWDLGSEFLVLGLDSGGFSRGVMAIVWEHPRSSFRGKKEGFLEMIQEEYSGLRFRI